MAALDWTNIITTLGGGVLGWLGARSTGKSSEKTAETESEAALDVKKVEVEGAAQQLQEKSRSQQDERRDALKQALLKAHEDEAAREDAMWNKIIDQSFSALVALRASENYATSSAAEQKQLELIDSIFASPRVKEFLEKRSFSVTQQAILNIERIEEQAKRADLTVETVLIVDDDAEISVRDRTGPLPAGTQRTSRLEGDGERRQ